MARNSNAVYMKGFFKEFKAFAVRGNVADLAVAVIIGAAFGKIVSSLVDTIVMPLFSIVLGGINFSTLSFSVGATVVKYGVFLQSIVDFTIISFVIFVAIKAIHRVEHLEATAVTEEKPVPVSDEVRLLIEIRDLLQKK